MRWQPGILLYQLLYYYAVVISIREVDGFAVIKNNPSAFYTKVTSLHLKDKDDDDNDNEGDSWDSEEDYDQFESEDEEDEFPLSTPNLGIDIGSQLKPLTIEEAAELRAEAEAEINQAFDSRLEDIEELKKLVDDDFERSKKEMQIASDLRAKDQTNQLMGKIDQISNDFLSKNKALRDGTKLAAAADENMKGKGLDVGSWGSIAGKEVLTSSSSEWKALLGSVGSAQSSSDVVEAEGFEETVVPAEKNRILIVCDDQQDKSTKKVLDKFVDILSDTFDSDIEINKYSPTSSIPMGGDSAQCVILVASALNGQSSAQNLLGRILKRTAPIAGGKIGVPPSHLIVLSTQGTERTDKFPYSMQNLMGGNKLTKRREVEEAIITTVKARLEKRLNVPPMDYTVLKLGEVVDDDKALKGGDISLVSGDTLDGEVGVNAAANTLLQAVAYQPAARNATFSIAGGLTASYKTDDDLFWNSLFLKLDGPELLRMEKLISTDDEVDRKFQTLSQYIIEWSNRYKTDAKKEGLTTPVNIVVSNRPPSLTEGVSMRSGVRFEFKSTNTGSAYQSKSEERSYERQDTKTKASNKANENKKAETMYPMRRQKKEGGVEIFVEKTTSNELRVRARRCNMDDKTNIKEISEVTLVKKLQRAVDVWAQLQ